MITFKKLKLNKKSKIDQNIILLMEQFYQFDLLSWDLKRAQHALKQLLKHQSFGLILGIYLNNTNLIGYMALGFGFSLECGGREAFIDELFILKQHRGLGIGTLAIKKAFEVCKKERINTLRLEVTKNNRRTKKFYQKLGFKDNQRTLLVKNI